MSKRLTQNSALLLRTLFGALIACGSVVFPADLAFAQDGGFSIFESPAEPTTAPIVVSPKEAFTSPTAKLPKGQFGTFGNTPPKATPQLNGSRAIGTYANDGRSMFKHPPHSNSADAGKLKPFASNSLRADDRPQPDEKTSALQQPPVVTHSFQNSARRLPSTPKTSSSSFDSSEPKVAQVAFQDGGFNPQNRPPQNRGGGGFGQPSGRRFGNRPSPTTNSFGTNPIGTRQPSAQQNQPRSSNQPPRSGISQPTTQRPPARTAALPQRPGQGQLQQRPGQGIGQQRPGQGQALGRTANQNSKTGTKAAKELLSSWTQKKDSDLKLPGKRMTLRSFLAQPINGSRKEAINQYWITFSDMASHKIAVEQSQWLNSITNVRQPADQAVLKVAQQSAANRVLHSEIQLAKSQSMLHDYLPNFRYKNGKNIPVLPADYPWVGKLNTMYKEYQSRGMVPAKFAGIDEYLPKTRQLIANQADSVAAASQAAEQAKRALSSGSTPVSNVLEAVRIKSKIQQDFLATVTGYNRAITDYVLSVRQDIYQPERLASVLIGRKAVQKSIVATTETPQEDVDPLEDDSNPTFRQISTGRSPQSQSLQGKSAYQNPGLQDRPDRQPISQQSGSALSQRSGQAAASPSPFSSLSSSDSRPTAKKSFEYGPSAAAAKKVNFDPAKVKEELPMQQAKQAGSSSGYTGNNGNVAGSRVNSTPSRTASNPGTSRQPWNGGGTGGQPNPIRTRPVENRAAAPQGTSNSTGSFPRPTAGNSSPPTRTHTFPPRKSAAPTTPPATRNPFPTSSGSNSGTTSPIVDRAAKAFGGGTGTFGGSGATPNPKAPASSGFGGFKSGS